VRATSGGSSSVSVGELCPGIDQLDEVGPEGTSAVSVQDQWRIRPHVLMPALKDREG
jgi:hypothetical protein